MTTKLDNLASRPVVSLKDAQAGGAVRLRNGELWAIDNIITDDQLEPYPVVIRHGEKRLRLRLNGYALSPDQDGIVLLHSYDVVEVQGPEVVPREASATLPESSLGAKHDAGKPRAGLLFALAKPLQAVVAVLSFGAAKYAADSWQEVPNAEQRYRDALYRHQLAREAGEVYDPETGLPHRAHEITNQLFLLWFDIKNGTITNFTDYNQPNKE